MAFAMMQSGSSDDSSRSVKRGDIVWVRVHFPHKWRPALVLSSRDNLGVQVTFSFSENDAVSPSPTFFVESEVVPFEEALPSLISRRNLDAPPLHSALRLLGLRVLSGLRCHCITGRAQAQQQPAREFDTVGVLGFVLDAAVSPWVEPAHFAHAVRVVAQVHAFRSYCSVKHRKMYKQNKKAGDNVKLLPSSSLSQKVHKVTQESVALESKEKCLIVSKNRETNITIGDIKRLNSTVPLWEGNSARLFENKNLIISQNLVHSRAIDPLYMVRESLKSARQSFLGFKNISDQGIVDICFEDFSNMSRTHISVPSNFMIHLRNYIDKRKDNALGLCWRLPDKETIIYLNRRKRRRLDKSASCNDFPQISEVQESERCADISTHTTPSISDIKMLEPEGSIQKDHQASTYVCETSMNFTEEFHKVDSKRIQSCESLSNLVHHFHSDKCEVDGSEAKAKGMLGSDSSVYQERLHMCCNRDTTPLNSKRSAKYILKLTRPRISDIKMLEQEGSIQKHHQASTSICETSMNFIDEVQKADSKRSQTCEPVSNLVHPFHSDKCEVDANAAKVKGTLESDSSVYQERLQMSCNSVTTPLKSKRSARTEISSGDCLVEGKDCYEGVASHSIFNSNVRQLSKTHVPFSPKALLMKFPKNFNLPSKEQLVKKFSVFGSVDSYRTRVFCYAGSAQVSFLQEADAVAAFKYAKKKALFGKANVRFWLDPFEHKRRGFNPSSKQTGQPLKSCLKNSNSLSKENRKKHHRVRFTISAPLPPSTSNQTGPPLKSCLKNSNSLSKENRKKNHRVRFTIET
ncbi:hypothetical protein AAZX31_04G116700 [Glycine max]|uniref:PWWP domain-containing protein n=1 Tax=Glycine max TaxID=3847 RepID=A0A0R0KE61_SOYBN|nr:uncharacterized protein LOC102667640 [Glycine max]KAG5034820.1 hypothetical protein JHK87_009730 [Glycine soja]KAG5066141.1 hypothetical protein JHK86_009872 [Glycine max]KAH1253713.1 hypothetical protein GmHk_04G010311 [Glycine max]KRH62699.1 hypothetical protein GLYMA_04G124900v4 [Glycine max]|eukprot:XP_006578393.1 uncharacterized protein LOC102667640 [Glycine max]